MGPLGMGVGGIFAGLNAARAANEERQRQQQQQQMMQDQFRQDMDLRQQQLKQQGETEYNANALGKRRLANEEEQQDRSLAGGVIKRFEDIVYDPDAKTKYPPEFLAGAQAKLNHLYDLNPAFDPRPAQPQQPQQPSPQDMFGPQAGPGQVNPSIGGELPNAPPPQTPTGAAAPPPVAGPPVPPNGPQAPPVDPNLAAFDQSITHLQQRLSEGGWSPQQEDAINESILKLKVGKVAMQHQLEQLKGEQIGNKYAAPEAEARIGSENAQAGEARARTLAIPIQSKAQLNDSIASVARAQIELQKIRQGKQPTPADQIKAQELQLQITKETKRQQEWKATHDQSASHQTFEEDREVHNDRRADDQANSKSNPAGLAVLHANLQAALKNAMVVNPVTGRPEFKPGGYQAFLRETQRLGGQGATAADVNPPGIEPRVWSYIASGGDVNKALKDAASRGRKDLVSQFQRGSEIYNKLGPAFNAGGSPGNPRHNTVY